MVYFKGVDICWRLEAARQSRFYFDHQLCKRLLAEAESMSHLSIHLDGMFICTIYSLYIGTRMTRTCICLCLHTSEFYQNISCTNQCIPLVITQPCVFSCQVQVERGPDINVKT